jgi:hypothetical protein
MCRPRLLETLPVTPRELAAREISPARCVNRKALELRNRLIDHSREASLGIHARRCYHARNAFHSAEQTMKAVLCFLLALSATGVAWADVQIEYRDITGATGIMRSNGQLVRIDGGRMSGYMLLDGDSGEFFMVDTGRNEIIKVSADEIGRSVEVGALNVSLKPRGGGEKVAGYATGRYDLIADGQLCGTLYGSSELIQNSVLRRMFEAMQGMHKISRSLIAGMAPMPTACQRASARLADLVGTSGFVMRVIDDQGKQVFEVISIDTDRQLDADYYALPSGMQVVDMDEKMRKISKLGQQILLKKPGTQEMMKQIQQSGGEMTPEIQQQLQDLMERLQQPQTQ